MAVLQHTGLAAALRAAQSPRGARDREAWRQVEAAVRRFARGERVHGQQDELLQKCLLRVHRTDSRFEDRHDGAAVKYLRQTVERLAIDMQRTHTRRRRRERLEYVFEDGGSEFDLVAAPEPTREAPDDEVVLEEAYEQLSAHMDAVIQAANLKAGPAQTAWLQANAAVLARCRELSAPEIAAALGVPGTPNATIHQWRRRGRRWVSLALDAWQQEADPSRELVIAEIRRLVEAERADAGKPRAARKRGVSKATKTDRPHSRAKKKRVKPARKRATKGGEE